MCRVNRHVNVPVVVLSKNSTDERLEYSMNQAYQAAGSKEQTRTHSDSPHFPERFIKKKKKSLG